MGLCLLAGQAREGSPGPSALALMLYFKHTEAGRGGLLRVPKVIA